MGKTVTITALVCTCNRGASVEMAVRSILANPYEEYELIVVDQSTNRETAEAMRPYLSNPRVQYIRSDTRGLGRARNIGISHASGQVVAMTDDDCEVPADWISQIHRMFSTHPEVAVAFCNVQPAPHDPTQGFIPHYLRKGSKVIRTIREKCGAHGIGAGMAVRKEAMHTLGGFDQMLGPGAPFSCFDDVDVALRALLKGFAIYETDAISVLHYGFRALAEGPALIKRDFYGIGAGYAKLFKCGKRDVISVFADDLHRLIFHPLIWHLIRLRKPPILKRILSMASGFRAGLRTRVDKDKMLFVA